LMCFAFAGYCWVLGTLDIGNLSPEDGLDIQQKT